MRFANVRGEDTRSLGCRNQRRNGAMSQDCKYRRPCNCCPCGHCDCFFEGTECCGCGEQRELPDVHTEARLNDIHSDSQSDAKVVRD